MTGPPSLNALRDEVVRDLRALVARVPGLVPGERKLKGILGRSEGLLATQRPAIDRLAALDLDAAGPDAHEAFTEVVVRVLHVPRMAIALGEVLRQEQGSHALAPARTDAVRVNQGIDRLVRAWIARHVGAEALEDDEEGGEGEGELLV